MNRLLTDKEIIDNVELAEEKTYDAGDGSSLITFDVTALLEAQHKKTLKAVGEWLEKHRLVLVEEDSEAAFLMHYVDFLKFKIGVMPE